MGIYGIFSIIFLVIIAIIIYDFVSCYLKSKSTGWQRVWDAGRGSATMVAVQLGTVVSLLVASADKVTDWVCAILNDQSASDQIKAQIAHWVTPTSVGVATTLFLALVAWARFRTLNKG